MRPRRKAALADQLTALMTMSPAALRQAWQEAYNTEAPRLSPDLLRLGLAYRLQEQAIGPLSTKSARALRPGAQQTQPKRDTPSLREGAQLVRTWNGRTLCVVVEQDGFSFEGCRYRSLSSIAREVTGAGWSGPRFFGLTDRKAA